MEERKVGVLIVGSGPTGLGAATRLNRLGEQDWLLVDEQEEAGGLACTDVTSEGFLFDMGGHVIFSHFSFFDDLLEDAVGKFNSSAWVEHQRVSYVRICDGWVPYPFQNNLCCLPIEEQITAINGMVEARVKAATDSTSPETFDEWILRNMGTGIADLFMRPYNFKVWAVPTTEMQCKWLGERVAVVDTDRAIANVLRKTQDVNWGPNATFKFPSQGGTGAIWKSIFNLLPKSNVEMGSKLVSVNAETKTAVLLHQKTGKQTVVSYQHLISTVPLDALLGMLEGISAEEKLQCSYWSKTLFHSSTHVLGLGIRGVNPHELKCWLYFPEDNCPFYRVTVFSHYAPGNVPTDDTELKTLRRVDGSTDELDLNQKQKGPYWSLMFEVSESNPYKPVDVERILEETIQGSLATGLTQAKDEIVSTYHRRIEHGYPTPSLKRDGVLNEALPWLSEKASILSRGRFGSYKYEVANQDHSLILGVEAVDHIVAGKRETTLDDPNLVNSGKKRTVPAYTTRSIDDLKQEQQ